MSDAVEIRPYQAGDEAGLVRVWNAAMWADPIDLRAWRERYLLDPVFDPRCCLVADSGGDLVGFAFGMHPVDAETAWIVGFGVVPERRRQGIGTALLDRLQQDLERAGARRVVVGPYVPTYVSPGVDEAAYAEAVAFLQARGYATESRPLSMRSLLTGYRGPADARERRQALAGEGIVIREATAADILPLLEFLRTEFPHWSPDATGVMQELFAGDPVRCTMHLAEDQGIIIGFAQSRAERFGPFGVNPAYRGRGVGGVLLQQTLLAMRARGFHAAWFLWTSDRAARLYRQYGFEEVRRFSLLALNID